MTDPAPGGVPDGYQAIRTLAVDGAGRAELCRAPDGHEVVLRATGVGGDASADLLTELAAAAAAAKHPCAVGIDRCWDDPTLGVCVERRHLSGGSLADRAGNPMSSDEVAAGGIRLAAGLSFAHSRGVLHGDVRPAHVLVDAAGSWLLADIGVARAVARATPDVPVTPEPAFTPRELRGWEHPAPSADVYGLGAVLYAALAGAAPLPNSGSSAAELPAVPPRMATLIDRMMAPNPADRPSLVEVDRVLRAVVPAAARGALPALIVAVAPVSPPRPKLPVIAGAASAAVVAGRNRVLVAAAAIGVVFLGGATAVAVGNSGGGGGKGVLTAASAPPVAVSAAPTSAAGKPVAAAPKVPAESSKAAAPAPKPAAAPAAAAVAPQPAPAAPPAAYNMAKLIPFEPVVEPLKVNGTWRLKVSWRMSELPAFVSGWTIYIAERGHGAQAKTEEVLMKQVAPKQTYSYFDVSYVTEYEHPIASCVLIQTQAGPTLKSDLSKLACPTTAQVQAAQGSQASHTGGTRAATAPANSKPAWKPAATPKPTATAKAKH